MKKKYIFIAGFGIVLLGASGFAVDYFKIIDIPGIGNNNQAVTEIIPTPAQKKNMGEASATPIASGSTLPEKSIAPDPKYSKTLTDHAQKLIISQKLEEAIPILERAVALDPENETAVESLRLLKEGKVPVFSPTPDVTKPAEKIIDSPAAQSATPESKTHNTAFIKDDSGDQEENDQDENIQISPLPSREPVEPEETVKRQHENISARATPVVTASATPQATKVGTASHAISDQDKLYAQVLTKHAVELANAGEVEEAQKLLQKARELDPESSLVTSGATGDNKTGGAFSQIMPAFDTPKVTEVTPDPEQTQQSANCEIPIVEDEIDKFFFDNIELFTPLPKQFRVGEIYLLSGGINKNNTATKAAAFFGPKDDSSGQVSFSSEVKDGIFHIPVYFSKPGKFLFSVHPGEKGMAKAVEIEVVDPSCEPEVSAKSKAPDSLRDLVKNGSPVIAWSGSADSIFRIEFRQAKLVKKFYVKGSTEIALPLDEFKDFTEGDVNVMLWGALAGKNSLEQKSAWAFGGEKKFKTVRHVSRKDNLLTDVTMTEKFEPKGEITIYGKTNLPLSDKLVIVPPDEKIFEVDLEIEKGDFSGHFTTDQNGPYLVEINQNDKLSLFTGAAIPSGSLAILPDYFDLSPAIEEKFELDDAKASEELLRYVNRERATRKLGLLKMDDSLKNLAQSRADDMCKRKYFGHVNPDGKDAGDFLKTFHINVDIGENLAEGSNIRSSHEALMRSPEHRELIIDPDFASIGFGYCWEREQKGMLTSVEIFGKKP